MDPSTRALDDRSDVRSRPNAAATTPAADRTDCVDDRDIRFGCELFSWRHRRGRGRRQYLRGLRNEPACLAEALVDSNSDGVVEFSPPTGVPEDSIWAASDLSTIRTSVRSAGDLRPAAPIGQLKLNDVGGVRSFEDERLIAFGVLVAKGKGAWWLSIADGSNKDGDGKDDGAVEVDFADAEPLTSATPAVVPVELDNDDHVVWIDPDRMEYLIAVVSQLPAGGS